MRFHPQEDPRGVRSIETGSRWWGQGLGKGRGSECFTGTEFQFGKRRKFWRRPVGTVAQPCACAQRRWAVRLKGVKGAGVTWILP